MSALDSTHSARSCFRKRNCLDVVWILGLFAGGSCFLFGANHLVPLMRVFQGGDVSIVRPMCLVFLIPFLSVFFTSTGLTSLLYIVCFTKAFLYAFTSVLLLLAYGSAGWFVRFVLEFGTIISEPVLYFLWIRCLNSRKELSAYEILFFFGVFLLIESIEFRVITPFWTNLYS